MADLNFLNDQVKIARQELATFNDAVKLNPTMGTMFAPMIAQKEKQIADFEKQIVILNLRAKGSSKKDNTIQANTFKDWIKGYLITASYDFEIESKEDGSKSVKVERRNKSFYPELDSMIQSFNDEVTARYKMYLEHLKEERKTAPNYHLTFKDWGKVNNVRMTSPAIEPIFRQRLTELNNRVINRIDPLNDPMQKYPESKLFLQKYEQFLNTLVDALESQGYSPMEKERLISAIQSINGLIGNGQSFLLRELMGNCALALGSCKLDDDGEQSPPWGYVGLKNEEISQMIFESLKAANLLDETDIIKVIPSIVSASPEIKQDDSEDQNEVEVPTGKKSRTTQTK